MQDGPYSFLGHLPRNRADNAIRRNFPDAVIAAVRDVETPVARRQPVYRRVPVIDTQLRIWQDANQDGISEAAELTTLAQQGIASINVTGQPSTIQLGNGNSQPWSGSLTRTNGTTGDSGTPELSARSNSSPSLASRKR